MINPIHFGFNTLVYYAVSLVSPIEFMVINLFYIALAELIDLDHLFSKPIYDPKRNSFKTHFFHRKWRYVILFSVITMYWTPFFSLALLSHLLLDYIDAKYFMKL